MKHDLFNTLFGKRGATFLAVGVLFVTTTSMFGDVLPAERRISAWNPGVRGGIPARTNLINAHLAPYNADNTGAADATSAIQSAINAASAGSVVYLPAGTYLVSGGLSITKAISLSGDGPNLTVIKYVGTSASATVISCSSSGSRGNAINVTGGSTKESTSITVASTTGISVGTYLMITQNNPAWVTPGTANGGCSWCGDDHSTQTMSQVNKVVGISGTTLTLERPLYGDFVNAPIIKTLPLQAGMGIEKLTVWRANTVAVSGFNLYFVFVANCWVSEVTSTNAGQAHIRMYDTYACTIEHSRFHDAYTHGSDHGYGIHLFGWNSDHYIVDNIFWRCRHSINFEGGGSGNVIAYNYGAGCVQDEDPTFLTEEFDTHGSHPFMNLFEGNITGKLSHDNTWGSASHNTSFRSVFLNYSSQAASPNSGRWGVDIEANNYSNNIVACIIGRSGDTGSKIGASWNGASSYRFGVQTPGGAGPVDALSQSSTYIHGTYDYISKTTQWDANNTDHILPASLYLTSKPAWFGDRPWPPIDPATPATAVATNLPAGYRYTFGVNPAPATGILPPPPPTGLHTL